MTAIIIEKCKVGPITQRYLNGDFQSIEAKKDGIKRMAICGLDNSHNGDYKVSYASDPLLTVRSPDCKSHDQLQAVLEERGMWLDEFTPIYIPEPQGEWGVAFKSLPRSKNRLSLFKSRAENVVDREMDILEDDNSLTAYV